jgi:hypothetical protein
MKNLKHIKGFNEITENLNISDVRSSKKVNENQWRHIAGHDILSKDEKNWLKNWLDSCNQQWGFETKDFENMKTIFTKLDIN